jgi:hypothetical protein
MESVRAVEAGHPVDEVSVDRAWGRVWIAAAIACVGLMAFHPVAHGSDMTARIEALLAVATRDRIVHGGLIVALTVASLGAWRMVERLAERAHPSRVPTVRSAVLPRLTVVALLASAAAHTVAALVSGFLNPALAERYADGAAADLEALRHLFRLCWEVNQVAAKLGVAAAGAALVGLGLLLRRAKAAPRLASSALLLGSVQLLAVVSGHLRLHLHAMLAVVVAHSAFNVAAALQLQRGRFGAISRDPLA